ncbi:MAG: hypothetical protein AB1696_23420 [Planctomycetota bacterium]
MATPRVLTRCVANHYAGKEERIVEYSFGDGIGGLISFRQCPDGTCRVDLYRHNKDILVVVGKGE